jgi:ATP-dependent Clp protease ATP-binding subunit ClpB
MMQVIFEPLSPQAVQKIIKLEINDLNGRLTDRDIVVECTDAGKVFGAFMFENNNTPLRAALKHIELSSFSPTYGARPLKRWIDRNITTVLSQVSLTCLRILTPPPPSRPSHTDAAGWSAR